MAFNLRLRFRFTKASILCDLGQTLPDSITCKAYADCVLAIMDGGQEHSASECKPPVCEGICTSE